MPRTQMHIAASPEDVFEVLADGDGYADWVVGARRIRRASKAFPEPGAALQPSVGAAPFTFRGRTEVVRADPPRMLELDAQVKQFHARIRFELTPDETGTHVLMEEGGVGTFSRTVTEVARPLIIARNAETLWRLNCQVLNNQDVSHPAPSGASSLLSVPRWVGDTTARVFGTLAALRNDRAFHPRGVTHRGRARLTDRGAKLAPGPEPEVLVRFSRGAGLFDRLPDVNGLAVRFVDAAGRGRHRDVLLASAGPGLLRHLLVPAVDFGRSRFSSILRYRFDGEPVVLVASVEQTDVPLSELRKRAGIEVTLSAVYGDGKTETLVELTTTEIVDDPSARFSPNAVDDVLVPLGVLNALRAPAYAASQASTAPRS